ncbi:hypothetical protein ACJJTC_012292 [Scirpophaga incertulas]
MSNVPCPSGTNSDQFEGQVSIGSEDALADSNIPDVGSNDDVAEAISVTKSNSEISVPKPVEDPSEPTCTPNITFTDPPGAAGAAILKSFPRRPHYQRMDSSIESCKEQFICTSEASPILQA